MGYKVNNWFRTDLVLDYRSTVQAGWNGPSITCTTGLTTLPYGQVVVSAQDTCTSHFNTEIHRWDLLANGYVDIGSWGGFTLCWGWRRRHLGADQAVGQLNHEQ